MRARAAAPALALLALAAPASANVRSESQLRQWVEWIDSSPDWSASAKLIRSNGDVTIAEDIVISCPEPEISVQIGELRLADLEEESGGGFSASRIEWSEAGATLDMSISPPSPAAEGASSPLTISVDYRIPSATVDGLSVPSFAGFLFDMSRPLTSFAQAYSLLAQVEFGEVLIPEIATTQRQPIAATGAMVEGRSSVRNWRMSGMRDGVIASQEIGPGTFATSTPEGEVRVEIERTFAEQMDFAALAHAIDPAAYRDGKGDGIWRPALSRLGYSGFSLEAPEAVRARIDEIVIEGVDMRQADEPFATSFDRLLDPATPEAQKSELLLEALLDVYSTFRLGTFRVNGIAVDNPAEQASFALGSMTLSGLSNGGIDSFILKSLSGRGPAGFASIDGIEFAGLVFPDVRALMQFAALESDAEPQRHAETVRATFAAMPRIAHVGLTNLIGGQSEASAVKLAGFTIDFANWNDFFAEETDIRLEGLDVPRALADLDPKAAQMMDELGYDRLVFGMSLQDRWTPRDGSDKAVWTASMRDAADVELSYALTGVTPDWIIKATAAAGRSEDQGAATMAMLADLGLEKATLKLTDRSLLDRGFNVAAKLQGLTIEGPAYREQMRGALPFLLSAAVPASISKLLSKPLQEFLAGGQTLVAEIAPPQPIPLLDVVSAAEGDPMALPERLGIAIRAEAPAQ